MRVRLKGVNTVKAKLADGRRVTYYYHRATGLRLDGKPGTPEFLDSFARAERTITHRDKDTFAGLIRLYKQSPQFTDKKADSTKAEYIRVLAKAEHEFGTLSYGALNDPRVRREFYDWQERVHKESGPREADNRLSIVSACLTWGVRRGHIVANHVAGFERLYNVDRSDKIWLPDHIAAFNAVAPIELQNALTLALHTGQRQGDLLRMAWANYDGLVIRIRQGKTGRSVTIPCTAALKTMLDEMPRKAAVILTEKTGRPWNARYFQKQWRNAMTKAGLGMDLRFHDLRGTAITMLAEAGCTDSEIAAISGHSGRQVSAILDKYRSRTAKLAHQAITKLENARATDSAKRLQNGGGE